MLFACVSACASALPEAPAERALVNDVRAIVRAQARGEWIVDRVALDSIMPAVAWSACQVTPEARDASLVWLDTTIAGERARLGGGTTRELWIANDRDRGELSDLIELERMRLALGTLSARATEDCPFWLEGRQTFDGIQTDASRFIALLESRGQGSLNIRGSDVALGGGGGGRLLVGAGLSERWTLVGGLELSGTGGLDEDGDVQALLGGAIPFVLRHVDAGIVFDVELALVTFLTGKPGIPPGVRAAIGYGFVTPRVAGSFAPQAVIWLGYEFYPDRDDDPAFHVISIGTRIGLDFDP